MSPVEVMEPEVIPDIERDIDPVDDEMPPIFGRCPNCGKPLRPRDRFTGEPKAPPIGQGPLSRAKCDKCGAIIEYVGNGQWVVVELAEQ
jgi:hypothetical protein